MNIEAQSHYIDSIKYLSALLKTQIITNKYKNAFKKVDSCGE